MPHDILVPPIGGVGHGRKRKLVTPEDYQPVFVGVHVPGRTFEVLGEADGLVASCQSDCGFWAYRGAYHVRVAPTLGQETKTQSLRISKPGDYALVFGDDGARDAGLVLGITGAAAFIVGTFVVVIEAVSNIDCGADDGDAATSATSPCKTPSSIYYGLATMGVGAGMAAGGFVLFSSNLTRFHYEGAPYPVTTRVGAVPMPGGGLGLGTTISF